MMDSLVRGDTSDFLHLVGAFGEPKKLDGTRSTVRTHFVTTDSTGTPAVDLLSSAMAYAVVDFCVPRERIEAANAHYQRTRSTMHVASLQQEAQELFVDADESGEGGELLLFLLSEQLLGLPQIIAKMPLKTSSQMHVHGADGVHARIDDEGILNVFWGESKLYKSSTDAFRDCFNSIKPFLAPDGHDARRRDLQLVRDNINVDHPELATHLVRYFTTSDPQALQVKWGGVCLIGFDLEAYPNTSCLVEAERAELSAKINRWENAVKRRVSEHSLVDIEIDVFCIPFPSVAELRKAVRRKLGGR
ncbi:Domain of unknown function (DUF1837) [Sanguibacter keddieii DSM 10542]|uniref:Anti-bacteriophage protein A/HamA C-terminal domain-containing protein n=1 Tax=Sanguibacter keddieii (strain ATCC 51767 / DSM 10542 / NCFB 3025 / ST-74) TaxID=446469 RepID=D1BHI5_SANKS|nr:Domain of unknown function (DUF1837) [Sanguibacter keddieii DSM 10542]